MISGVMAPGGKATDLGGFTAIPVTFSQSSRCCHYLYVKEHRVREGAGTSRPQDRTLFVLNVPPYCTQGGLRRLFSQCGLVQDVQLQEKPGPGTRASVEESGFFNTQRLKGFRVAYVLFKRPAALKSVQSLSLRDPWALSTASEPVPTGLQKWISDYASKIVDAGELQSEVDQFLQKYDEQVAKEEAQAETEDGVPDEDGWVKVTRRGRRPGIPRTEASNLRAAQKEKRNRARRQLLNFYTWQHRETKREHIAQLRKKFEEDKQKITLMRAQRKFRPY
ncbi:ribosomal RNA-processing protein 7 homolog A [Callorhinchus milii]|nr:ribosomal RNA-processing protein 7 homolog A [Callorhinchus milii]